MRVQALHWVGTRVRDFPATTGFFQDVLHLELEHQEDDFAVFRLPDGSTVEVFGPTSPWNAHLTAPTAGFLVDDLARAADELRAAGVEIVLPIQGGEERGWLHFRAPDGFVYELVEERQVREDRDED